jgi:hypothetical protein
VRFVAELRDFTDERRAQWLKKSGIDPLANLETLNRAGGKIGASQIMRSLDTADYFRLISEAPAEKVDVKPARVFPFTGFSDPGAVKHLEAGEAGASDPGSLEEDEYLREARRAVSREPWAVTEEIPLDDPALEDRSESDESDAPKDAAQIEVERVAKEAAAAAKAKLTEELGGEAEGLLIELPGPRGRAALEAGGIAWKGSRFHQDNLVETLESAFGRAKHGRGTFRFVQEPTYGPVAAALGRAIARFRADSFVLDTGAFPKQADATDFLRMVRLPLARVLGGENVRTQRMLSKRLSKTGGELVWAAAPLGTVLYGMDRPEPDPDFIDSAEGAELISRALLAFGRRTKPIVLIFRGSEHVGPSAHRILLELARIAPLSPVCCFVFFRRGTDVPEWHVLSGLDRVATEAEGPEDLAPLSVSGNSTVDSSLRP